MSKKQYCSQIQKDELVRLVTDDPNLVTGKLSNAFSFKDSQRKWENIAAILNSIPGGSKDWKKWRKTWQDIKSRTKTKKATYNRYVNGTGGGPQPSTSGKLSNLEEKVAAVICPTSITGNPEIEESEVSFTNQIEPEDSEDNFVQDSDINLNEKNDYKLEDVLSKDTISKQKRTVASARLQKSADATASLADLSRERFQFEKKLALEKFEFEKEYKRRKLEILERQAQAIENIAEQLKKNKNY